MTLRALRVAAIAGFVVVTTAPTANAASSPDRKYDYGTNASYAWEAGITGQGQTIAIVDLGTLAVHKWFRGQVIQEACFSRRGLDRQALCPGPNGTLVPGPLIGSGAAAPPASGNGSDATHGTEVAGVAAGAWTWSDGSTAFRGIATDASLVATNTGSYRTDLKRTQSTIEATGAAWKWLADNAAILHLSVVNVSSSYAEGRVTNTTCVGTGHQQERLGIQRLLAAGVVVVASAGNAPDQTLGFPGCLPGVIAVGGTQNNNSEVWRLSDTQGSSTSAAISVLAPAKNITAPSGAGKIPVVSGTSYAAPMVAGAVALYRQEFPDATNDEVRQALERSGTPVLLRDKVWKPALNIRGLLSLYTGPPGRVANACIEPRIDQSRTQALKRVALVRLHCNPASARIAMLSLNLRGPAGFQEQEASFEDLPLAPKQYYRDVSPEFKMSKEFRVEKGKQYRLCYSVYGYEDREWPAEKPTCKAFTG